MISRSLALAAALAAAGCSHREPPSPDASPSVAYPDIPPAPRASPAPGASGSARDGASPSAPSAPSPPPSPPPSAAPSGSADSALLPQTHDKPPAQSPAFDARVAALWDAIVADDPERAMPMFFPLGAYQQVKDVPNPGADWRHRLVAAYAHDIHGLHAALGADARSAHLLGLDVPEARARWVEPGEEYNKIGYYRVFGSQLRFEQGGATHAFDVKSLISWRGEWYVVHLSAIK